MRARWLGRAKAMSDRADANGSTKREGSFDRHIREVQDSECDEKADSKQTPDQALSDC